MRFRHLLAGVGLLLLAAAAPGRADDKERASIRFEISVLKGFGRYELLLAEPGHFAIALESNGLSPSLSSRLKVSDGGRALEIRGAFLRYTGSRQATHSYEAGIALGIGGTKLTFPVTLDTSTLEAGKVTVTLSPPLAGLIPQEFVDRIRLKLQLTANPSSQRKMLDYLDAMVKTVSGPVARGPLIEAILLDAYHKSSGPESIAGRDVGDALPVSEQWMLIVTLLIWVVAPLIFLVRAWRRSRAPR